MMCCNKQCLALVSFLIFILPLHSEWVEISVQNKPHYSTTEGTQESYNNISITKAPTTSSHFDFVNESLHTGKTRISHINKGSIKKQEILRRNGEENTNLSNAFLSILQDVQEDLLRKPHKDFKNKLNVLINLKNRLFLQIQNRISEMWPSSNNNNLRGYKDDSYLDFPSNEAAMLTIGFLTFAVFLIKLVLKIIHALKYKNQYYSYMPATMITTAGKRKRSIHENFEDIEFLKIVESVQNFPNNYYSAD